MHERGTTLVEVLIAAAIVALIAAAFFMLSQGARAFGMRSAAEQFDAELSYAQALAAASGNGSTIVFDRRLGPGGSVLPGFILTVYSGRPTAAGAMRKAPTAPMQSAGDVSEAGLGEVPFTIFLNGAGHASGMAGVAGAVLASDPGCPPGESRVVLTFSDPQSSYTRTIPCNAAVAGAPVTIGTVAPAATAVSPPAPVPSPTAAPVPPPDPTPTPAPAVPTATPVPAPSPTAAVTPTPVSPLSACTPDPRGWCAVVATSSTRSSSCFYWNAAHTKFYRLITKLPSKTYDVYYLGALRFVDTGTSSLVAGSGCPPGTAVQWSPGEPQVQAGDPSLP